MLLTKKKMNREELAKELDVRPWDVDDWLLLGCPAERFRLIWEFDVKQVKIWLKAERIRTKRMKVHKPHQLPTRPLFDQSYVENTLNPPTPLKL